MLIAIISDIHDNIPNLQKCLNWCQSNKIKKIICCGDVTNLETMSILAHNFLGEIFVVASNNQLYEEIDLVNFKNINYCGKIGMIEEAGTRIAFCHKKGEITEILQTSSHPLDFIFYGHSHKPWLERRGETIIANPGNIAGSWYQATFSTLNTENKNLELKILSEL